MNKSAMAGPRRFQWQMGGWFGGVFGGSAWLIPVSAMLALNGQPQLALLPAGCCLLINILGLSLWSRRDRLLPFSALVVLLAVFSLCVPLVWFAISTNATPESLAALHWPQQGIVGAMVAFIAPVSIAWFCILEYSYRTTPATH